MIASWDGRAAGRRCQQVIGWVLGWRLRHVMGDKGGRLNAVVGNRLYGTHSDTTYSVSHERMAWDAHHRGTAVVTRILVPYRLDALVECVEMMSLPRRGGKG